MGVCRQDRHVGHNADAIETGTRGIGVNTTIGARKLHRACAPHAQRDLGDGPWQSTATVELRGDDRSLRPMLKPWLDENLPSLVERMVEAEIERVARRR